MNFNKVIIVGNLTQNPERKSLPSGQSVVNFGVATNRFFSSQNGQKQQDTEFHNVVAFGKLAETICQYLNKGSSVLIEGRLRTRNWVDASGIKHYRTEIITERLQLGPKIGTSRSTTGFQPVFTQEPPINKPLPEEEIPIIEPELSEKNPDESALNNPENNPSSIEEDEEINVEDIPF